MNNTLNRYEWIENNLKRIPSGLKILDAGAGELRWKASCSHLNYVSQDFCEYKGNCDGSQVGLRDAEWDTSKIDIVSDIIDIPVEDESFDVVLCSEVLEHLPYPEMAIKELARVLKKGGELILTAPFCSLTHFAPYYYCNGFSAYWYEAHLKEYGLEIEEITPNGNYLSYMMQELGRLNYVLERYFSKKNIIINVLAQLLIKLLSIYEKRRNDSGELLCFGYFVRGKKV